MVVVTCPTPSQFQDLLEGRIGAGELDDLYEHVDDCSTCFSLLAELGRAASLGAMLDDRDGASTETTWPPSQLAEYRLMRLLGRGAGGEVWAAHDTLLDREVAIKFPSGATSLSARARFRREAWAVARLSHPNVVTVHRVGEFGARLFLVSELVRGDSLDRLPRPIPWPRVRAIALGLARGLAAAHAAGIVHRDLKPANAILGENGEVKLLDFGLARLLNDPAEIAGGLALGSPSLTATGAVVGTPLYLAPEAWRGEPPTYRMDIYSLGAVLYELCTGTPPHSGSTIEEVRNSALVSAPTPLAGIEPRFAAIVMRCLARDPAARFADGGELRRALYHLDAPTKHPLRQIGSIAAALVATGLAFTLAWPGVQPATTLTTPEPALCPAPPLDPDAVWSDAKRQELADRRGVEARTLDVDFAAWQAARARACGAGAAAQNPRHTCLNAVLVRFDVIARSIEGLPAGVPTADAGAFALDPSICEAARPPRLLLTATPELREVVATAMRAAADEVPYRRDAAAALVRRVAADPCAAALARLLLAGTTPAADERRGELPEAEQDAERCNDDRVRAEVALGAARHALASGTLGAAISAKIRSADVTVERVAQRDLTAEIDALRLETARRADHIDEAIAHGEAAVAGYAARGRIAAQLAIGLRVLDLRDLRTGPDDLPAVPRLYDESRALAARELGESHPVVRKIDAALAARMFMRGDVEGGHARLAKLWRPIPGERARRIRGRVVDPRGAPVEGATVTAGRTLYGDGIGAAVPFPGTADEQRVATTGKAGEFEIPDAPPEGAVIAQLGDARSRPAAIADALTLALEPTSRVEGRIDLRGEPASRVIVSLQDLRLPVSTPYELVAPVAPDGTFAVDGVPRARVRVYAVLRNPQTRSLASTTVDVRAPVVRGLAIAVARSQRVVHVIVRSTVEVPVGNAQVLVFPGHRASTNLLELSRDLRTANLRLARQIEGEHAPPAVVGRARAGDMFATMNAVPEGAATACAIGLPADLGDRDLDAKINANLARIEVRCEPIPPDADVAVVEVPPWPRLN